MMVTMRPRMFTTPRTSGGARCTAVIWWMRLISWTSTMSSPHSMSRTRNVTMSAAAVNESTGMGSVDPVGAQAGTVLAIHDQDVRGQPILEEGQHLQQVDLAAAIQGRDDLGDLAQQLLVRSLLLG